ncbi:MAG: HD domain-containing protein [Nitrospirae bacterium]|nr:HD domain-containing protein [Nitrospirota bacterium]
MNRNDLTLFKAWFSDFSRSYYSANEEDQKNISLKVDHTSRVCSLIKTIAQEQSLGENEILLAETAALFHDLGRFPQYARYKTFRDAVSINHGRLGAETLSGEGILGSLPENEQEIIINAVKFHNAFSLPDMNDAVTFILKLVRDADKLDIWRIFLGFFEMSEDERPSEAGLGLPDEPGYSMEVLSCICEKRTASLKSLKTLNDFKLLQLSWVYDLNYNTSVRLLLENDYIGRISSLLPQTEDIAKVSAFLQDYASRRLKKAYG